MSQEDARARLPAPLDRVDGRLWIVIALVSIALAALAGWAYRGAGLAATDDTRVSSIPPVHGYYAGEEILFLRTETSDAGVADMLGPILDSPVVLVPALADTPESALDPVYVFANGVQADGPSGPFGFQLDVFTSAPGDAGYTPLRTLHVVTWADADGAPVLRSAQEVEAAITEGRLAVERPGVVMNMPFLTWPGGER